jgi:hypothetical protein
VGEGVWQAPQPEGSFTYLEFHLDAIRYNVGDAEATTATIQPAPAIPSAGR